MQTLTGSQLQNTLCEVLVKWPLYRRLEYAGDISKYYLEMPSEILRFCTHKQCQTELTWDRKDSGSGDSRGYGSARYYCRNCKEDSQVRFYFYWLHDTEDNAGIVFKVGQHPPLEEYISPVLESQLQGESLDFYQKALRCRNFNYGLAAVAYLRRVVENKMNALLDLIAEVAKESGLGADKLSEIEKVKASWRFDDKIKYAAEILPKHLRPGGGNPLDALHDIASEGIHRKTDSECIDVFDKSKLVFEYLFTHLEVSKEEANAFVNSLNEIHQRKVKTK